MPAASPSPQRERSPVLFTQHDQRPSTAASDMISSGASDDEMDDSLSLAASDVEELSGSVTDPALFPTSAICNARLRVHEELIRVMIKAVIELGLEWSPPEGAISQQAGRVVFPRAPSGPPPTLIPLLPRSSQNRGVPPTRLTSVHLHPLLSHQLTALKRKYTSTWPLWMSPWPHISAHPQLSDGRRGRAIRPSRVDYSAAGQAASALHSMAVLQVFQANMLTSEEAGLDAASLRDMKSVTDLALRTTKATA